MKRSVWVGVLGLLAVAPGCGPGSGPADDGATGDVGADTTAQDVVGADRMGDTPAQDGRVDAGAMDAALDSALDGGADVVNEPAAPPRVDSVQPSTACVGGSMLTIAGAGFQAGASVTLACGAETVAAPHVVVSSDGTSLTATTSSTSASPGGTCDVIVTNPDGAQDPAPHQRVSLVPGPVVLGVDQSVVYNGINTRVTLRATTIVRDSSGHLSTNAVQIVPAGQFSPVTTLQYTDVPGFPNRLHAVVPEGLPPGTYDVWLNDYSGCFNTLPRGLTVTPDLTVTLAAARPSFGYTGAPARIQIARDTTAPAPGNRPFVATPRVYLNPVNAAPADVAIEVDNVALVDDDTVTGVVPEGTPVYGYDVVLVNPDGSVGILPHGYQEVSNPPPAVASVAPTSIVAATGQRVTLAGSGFDAADRVTVQCASGAMPPVVSSAPACTAGSCTQSVTIDGSALTRGDVCVLRVENPDGSYTEYSALGITNASLNLGGPTVGPLMNVGRRALAAAAGNASAMDRFVYALGGDNGVSTGALDSTEFARVGPFGTLGPWTLQRQALAAPRTLAGAVAVGRYLYLVGGNNGSGPVNTAERAMILSPDEVPTLDDIDYSLATIGLDPNVYRYRVSAQFADNDADNPGGETLASEPVTIDVRSVRGKAVNTLRWSAPVDSLGSPLPNVVAYRVYRALGDAPLGAETLLASVPVTSGLRYVDDGMATPGTATPLPIGSTGNWKALPTMGTVRAALAVVTVPDPVTPNRSYVYALEGATGPSSATATYEYLAVNVTPNGRQTTGTAWTAGSETTGIARSQIGAWVVDASVQSNYAPATVVFVGGGFTGASTFDGTLLAARMSAGGDLGQFAPTRGSFPSVRAGYGVCAGNQQLFAFGGAGGAPSANVAEGAMYVSGDPSQQIAPPSLALNAWNNEGLAMTHGRYLMGSVTQPALVFILGGQTDVPEAASRTTEIVVW